MLETVVGNKRKNQTNKGKQTRKNQSNKWRIKKEIWVEYKQNQVEIQKHKRKSGQPCTSLG